MQNLSIGIIGLIVVLFYVTKIALYFIRTVRESLYGSYVPMTTGPSPMVANNVPTSVNNRSGIPFIQIVFGLCSILFFLNGVSVDTFNFGNSPVSATSVNTKIIDTPPPKIASPMLLLEKSNRRKKINKSPRPRQRLSEQLPRERQAFQQIEERTKSYAHELPTLQPKYTVQVTACRDDLYFQSKINKLKAEFPTQDVHVYYDAGKQYYKILMGSFVNNEEANAFKRRLERKRKKEFYLVGLGSLDTQNLQTF